MYSSSANPPPNFFRNQNLLSFHDRCVLSHHKIRRTTQFFFSPWSPFIQSIPPQFGCKDSMQDHTKDPVQVNVYNIHFSPLQRAARNLIIKDKQIGQILFVLGNSLISVPDHNLVLHVCLDMASRWILSITFPGTYVRLMSL